MMIKPISQVQKKTIYNTAMQQKNCLSGQNMNTQPRVTTKYNPHAYRDLVPFKGKICFDVCFPTQILGVNEDRFDHLILSALDDPKKKNALINYIVSSTANDNQTMNFINMWRKSVPTVISQGLITNTTINSAGFLKHLSSLGAKNVTNNVFSKFYNSDYQGDILEKDGKAAAAGGIALWLFHAASADPEPYTKLCLYAGAAIVSLVGYSEKSKDSKKIQNKQLLDSIKEMIRVGALDPKVTLNQVLDKNDKISLSADKQQQYNEWKETRVKDLRYEKTGSVIDQHNDFETPEARNVLSVGLKMLNEDMGFTPEKTGALLQLYAAKYDSLHHSQEAEYLMRISTSIFEDINSPLKLDAMEILAGLCIKNEKPSEALKYYKEVFMLSNDNNDKQGEHRINSILNILELSNAKLYDGPKQMQSLQHEFDSTSSRRSEHCLKLYKQVLEQINEYYKEDKSNDGVNIKEVFGLFQKYSENGINDPKVLKLLLLLGKLPSCTGSIQQGGPVLIVDKDIKSRLNQIKNSIPYNMNKELGFTKTDSVAGNLLQQLQNPEADSNEEETSLIVKQARLHKNSEIAQIILGMNFVGSDNTKKIIKTIINKPDYKCSEIDLETLKLYAKNYKNRTDNEQFAEDLKRYCYIIENVRMKPFQYSTEEEKTITEMMDKCVNIAQNLYGKDSKEYYKTKQEALCLGHLKEMPVLCDFLYYAPKYIGKNAANEVRWMIARSIAHETYDKRDQFSMMITQNIDEKNPALFRKGQFELEESKLRRFYAMTGYIDYLRSCDKINPEKLTEFLDFLIYVNNSFLPNDGAMDRFFLDTVCHSFDLDKMCYFGKPKDENLYELKNWVQRAPGKFRINERKYWYLIKKFEPAFFKTMYENKIDGIISNIENNVDLPQIN